MIENERNQIMENECGRWCEIRRGWKKAKES